MHLSAKELQMHHGAKHSLRELTVEVLVEALDARDDKARREILGDIGVGGEAECTPALVAQSALAANGERVENKVIAVSVLIADASSKIAAKLPVTRKLPGLGNVNADVGVARLRA